MKINKSLLAEFLKEFGEIEVGDHRRGSTFYASLGIDEVTQDMIDEFGDDELQALLGTNVSRQGTCDDDYGFDSYDDVEVFSITKTVIPAHTKIIEVPETIKITHKKIVLE